MSGKEMKPNMKYRYDDSDIEMENNPKAKKHGKNKKKKNKKKRIILRIVIFFKWCYNGS